MEGSNIKSHKTEVALAGLDLSEMDNYVIQFSALLCKALSVRRIFFIHVARDLELPEDMLQEYPGLVMPSEESMRNDLEEKVAKYFEDNPDIEVNVIVEKGDAIEHILRHIKIENVDLIFMGRKRSLKGSGIVSSRLARKSPCSLLLVPENPPAAIEKVMVPVDFSWYAGMALSCANLIASSTGALVSCANVYKVPTGYHTTGKSHDEFAEIMKGHARRDYGNFLKSMGETEDIPCKFLLSEDDDYAKLLYEQAAIEKASLIIVGSRGRTAAAVALIGSLAEKLTYLNFSIPLLIIKKKGENMGFLQALLRV